MGTVEKVSRASDYIDRLASRSPKTEKRSVPAQLKVLVNPLPRQMIDCETIKTRYLEMGLRGKVAVITGASRGIGETAAKLFAMHGVRTVVHYHRGRARRRGHRRRDPRRPAEQRWLWDATSGTNLRWPVFSRMFWTPMAAWTSSSTTP